MAVHSCEAYCCESTFQKVESLDVDILKVLDFVMKTFDDVVTYQVQCVAILMGAILFFF